MKIKEHLLAGQDALQIFPLLELSLLKMPFLINM